MDNHILPLNFPLNNKYRIKKVLGQGGFGITYLAEDTLLDIDVCIKELFISGSSTRGSNMTVMTQNMKEFSFSDFKDRFLQEAKQLARFGHPNIVRVMEFFEANNTAYVVMEYIAGKNLKDYVAENGVMTEQQALPIIHQLFDAVEEVHNAGMLHRDLKPDNILLTAKNRVVLIDFGSAREFTEGKTITQTAMLTPGFAPIEQYSNRAKRGTFTDIYALGATMYFMLTGHKPIAATDRYREQLPAPYQLNPQINTQLSSAVMMAMEMKEEDRFQSVGDFRLALKHYLGQISIKGNSDSTIQIVNKPSTVLVNKSSNKQVRKWIAITLALCILCSLITYFLRPSSDSSTGNFLVLEKGFKYTNEIVDASVESTINQMTSTVETKPQLKPIADAAATVPNKIRDLLYKINELRVRITDESGGMNTLVEHKSKWEGYGYKKYTIINDKKLDGKPVGSKNKSVVRTVFISKKEGVNLKEEIKKTRKELISVIDNLELEIQKSPIDGVKLDSRAIENLKKELVLEEPEADIKWENELFSNSNVAAAHALLRKFDNDAKNSASQIVSYLSANMGQKVLDYDKYDVFAQAKKGYILLGETYEAEIALGTCSSQAEFSVNVNGSNLPIEDSKAKYTSRPSTLGTQRFTATINVKNPLTGAIETVKKDFEYEVGLSSVSVAADKMNVFYIGVDNPISISAAGLSSSDIAVSVSGAGGGQISGSGSKYIVKVTQRTGKDQYCNVTVVNKKTGQQIGSYPFRVKAIPNPIAKLSNNKNGGEISNGEMKVQSGLMAILEGFDFDAKCEIQSYTLRYTAPRQDPVSNNNNGGRFDARSAEIISRAWPGSSYHFINVKGRCPGDTENRELNSLAFQIK